jgi:hypothetical protein
MQRYTVYKILIYQDTLFYDFNAVFTVQGNGETIGLEACPATMKIVSSVNEDFCFFTWQICFLSRL